LYYPTHRIRTRVYEGNNINEKTQQIIDLLNKGVCQAQIAREVNVTRQRVNTVRNRYIKEPINAKAQERKALATEIFGRVLTLYQGLSKAEKETMAFEWNLLSLAEEYGVVVE
jgi:orotate phosphoribosyltransferase-like protein